MIVQAYLEENLMVLTAQQEAEILIVLLLSRRNLDSITAQEAEILIVLLSAREILIVLLRRRRKS